MAVVPQDARGAEEVASGLAAGVVIHEESLLDVQFHVPDVLVDLRGWGASSQQSGRGYCHRDQRQHLLHQVPLRSMGNAMGVRADPLHSSPKPLAAVLASPALWIALRRARASKSNREILRGRCRRRTLRL